MNVFISWSGEKSGAIARVLGDRLPDIIQSLVPFVSSEDIGAGQRWSPEIAARLDRSAFGIICVTADNQHAPWINFEAGTLAKAIAATPRVVPLLIDLSPTELTGPLTQFQAKSLDRAGLWDVVQEINKTVDSSLAEPRLERAFDGVWASIESDLAEIRAQPAATPSHREPSDVLDEILTIVRGMAKSEEPQNVEVSWFEEQISRSVIASMLEDLESVRVAKSNSGLHVYVPRDAPRETYVEVERLRLVATEWGMDVTVESEMRPPS